MNYEFGNAVTNAGLGGWLIGDSKVVFDPFKQSSLAKVKWGTHPKGELGNNKPLSTGYTISILVSGKFSIWIKDKGPEVQYVLSNSGDYVYWGEGIDHRWEALENSVVVTFRWPK